MYFAFSLILFILVPHSISLGSCNNLSFSICWMFSRNSSLDSISPESNIWLNATKLQSLGRQDQFTSLTVATAVVHNITLEYEGNVLKWAFSINPSTNSIQFRSKHKPQALPIHSTLEALKMFSSEVFACEDSTLYLYQDQDFILAVGHTVRLPLKLESRSASMLLLSWMEGLPATPDPVHSVSLYHSEMKAFAPLSVDSTQLDHYRFTALQSCSPYAACVELAGTHSLTCLYTITDPEVPRNVQVTSWNNTSVTVAWDCPQNRRFSLFFITVFYLNGTDHVLKERSFRHMLDTFVFTVSDLAPCSRVTFGLQTVCESGTESRFSKMILVDGNAVHSQIEDLHQISSGPENYTLSWVVRNTSSISMFRIYYNESLYNSTLLTSHTVTDLQPCQQYPVRVEALCGESVLMSAKTVLGHTGPRGVLGLQYRSKDSTALWTAGTGPGVAFQYELSNNNGSTIRRGRLMEPVLRLPGLTEGDYYHLDVWEECDGEWSTIPAVVGFDGVNVPLEPPVLPLPPLGLEDDLGLQFDFSSPTLDIIVPWLLAVPLQDPKAEPRAELERIVKNKLETLLKGFPQKARVQLVAFEEIGNKSETKITFQTFDASITDAIVPLQRGEQLDHIQSLQSPNITVSGGIIYWDDPDECASPDLTKCPPNSLCINTLDSFTCVCQHGYYDISSAYVPLVDSVSHPTCQENGSFTQCLDRLIAGGIAKAFLIGYLGGNVEVVLNDGRCDIDESETVYFFRMSRKLSQCGMKRLVNNTHIAFQNTLKVTLSREMTITRRDLKVIWKCVYPRNYVRKAQVNVDLDWITSHSVVEYNSSHELGLAMTMYDDLSFTSRHMHSIALIPSDMLFFEVALQTNNTFASELLLEVVSCWATESRDPQDEVQGLFLRDGCPMDSTFDWLSLNGLDQKSRFSVQMFSMQKELPIYIHCLARICGQDEECTTNCTTQRITKRSTSRRDFNPKQTAVVSAGPLLVNLAAALPGAGSNWNEVVTTISVVGGTIGLLVLTVLCVSATKAIITYYERVKPQ